MAESKDKKGKNPPEEREAWGNHCEFFLTSLGLAVGLGNVWRFPYVAFQNGGGSFLIPYLLMLLLVGLPAFFVELTVGQYARVGANKVFGRMVPAFKGLGYGMLLVRFYVNIYYVVVCAWSLYYLCVGFTSQLPWQYCGDHDRNTIGCFSKRLVDDCMANETLPEGTVMTYYNGTCLTVQDFCGLFNGMEWNEEETCKSTEGSIPFKDLYRRVSPSEDYYNRVALGLTYNYEGDQYTWENFGPLKWELVLCLGATWVLVALSLFKGVSSLGKAAYVITLSPYFILTALLVYAAPRSGASAGIIEFLTFKFDDFKSYDIWSTAASQIFFSLSVGYGGQLALSSYNQFNNNCHRDAFIIGICNSLTSVFAGIVVFAILGNLADGKDISEVVTQSIGLAFVAYPEATISMDIPPLWSFLFFFMLINLALSSICSGVQTFVAFVLDEKPEWTQHRLKIVLGSCFFYFLLGLPMCCCGGIHLFKIFDSRCSSSLLLLSLIEVIMVAWFYGVDKFLGNIAEMKMKLSPVVKMYWKVMWLVVSPVIMSTVIILKWVKTEPMTWKNGPWKDDIYEYPAGVQIVGWIFELSPTIVTLLYPLWVVKRYREKGYSDTSKLVERILQPSDSWEKTTGAALSEAKINEAFYDDSVYEVTPVPTKKSDNDEDAEKDDAAASKETGEEKMTEL